MIELERTASSNVLSTNSIFNGVHLCTRIVPAEHAPGGGDWCETFALSRDVVALSIGDVCGHGMRAYPAMVAISQAVREAALLGMDPSQTLAEANRFVGAYDPELHATAIFATFDTRHRKLTFANAGHPPPLLVGRSGTTFLSYPVSDLPLGVEPILVPELRAVTIPEERLLVLYTDGVTEHERRPLSGEEELREAARISYRRSTPPTDALIENLMALAEDTPDDASMLTAWTPPQPGRRRPHRRLR